MSDDSNHGRAVGRRTVLGVLGAGAVAGVPLVAGSDHDGADGTDATTTFTATVERADEDSLDATDIVVGADALADVDREVGDQVRVRRADDALALYTVAGTGESDDVVELSEAGLERLDGDDGADVTVDATVPHPSLTAAAAREAGELVERLDDPGTDEFLVAAPHGGRIEPYTDAQGALLAYELDADVTFWRARGWHPDGDAFKRWHVPTHELSPTSFTALGEVADRGFRHGVSFQGIAADGVRVGGGAPASVKEAVVNAIADAVADDVDVEVATGRYRAESEDVLVNDAVTDGDGLWIGQSFRAREDHREAIVEAVAATVEDP